MYHQSRCPVNRKQRWVDFDSPAIVEETPDSVTVDLIQLSNEEPIEFAFGDLPEGKVNQIRLIISDSSLLAYEDVVGIDGPDPGDDITAQLRNST